MKTKQIIHLIYSLKTKRDHVRSNNSAQEALKTIEKYNGKTDPKLLKLSNQYAGDVFGSRKYAPWLYVYCALAGRFKEGWIPRNYYRHVVVPKRQGGYGIISTKRAFAGRVFNNTFFPDIAYKANGVFLTSNYEVIAEKCLIHALFKNNEIVVFKSDGTGRGQGVTFLTKSTFDINLLKGDGVFQTYIKQHEFFNEFMKDSVATLRVITVINRSGHPSVRAANLRLGRSEETHVRADSNIGVPVNIKTGQLGKYGYTSKWLQIEKHPDTNVFFENKHIPYFSKCVSVSLELQKMVPMVQVSGWDLVINHLNDVVVMEWNGFNNGIKFSEATQGPCFSDLGWEKFWKEQSDI